MAVLEDDLVAGRGGGHLDHLDGLPVVAEVCTDTDPRSGPGHVVLLSTCAGLKGRSRFTMSSPVHSK